MTFALPLHTQRNGHGRSIGERVKNPGGCGPGTIAGADLRYVWVTLDRDGEHWPFNPSELSDAEWNARVEP